MKARAKALTAGSSIVAGIGGLVFLYFGDQPPEAVVALCEEKGFAPVEISESTWACGEDGAIKAFLEGAEPVSRRTR